MDAEAYRRESRAAWGRSAPGWGTRRDFVRDATIEVSMWLVEAIDPQPGHRVLELAAGPGEVGFLAHELIQPGGELICSDFSPEMLTAAQRRARELGLAAVRFKQIDAESIDLDAASVDGVLCRWGYMLMADPAAALRETRRVLKPGGRVALAAWCAPADNPWSSLVQAELVKRGVRERPRPGEPGQYAWADEEVLRGALDSAGFGEVHIQALGFEMTYRDFDGWLEATRALSATTAEAMSGMPDHDGAIAALRDAAAPYERADGSLVMPAKTWVAAATA